MKIRQLLFGACIVALVLAGASEARAALIIDVLGNDTPGFNDGDFVGTADLIGIGVLATSGNELFGPDFSVSYTHVFGAITDPILSATLEIGLHDSEGGSVGEAETGGVPNGVEVTLADEQLDFFDADSTSLRSLLLTDFEAAGQGENGQYEVYSVMLPAALFPSLVDGSLTVDLGLKGPVFSPAVLAFLDDQVNDFNAGTIVFSKLTIDVDSVVDPPVIVPEPATLLLLGTGLAAVGYRRRRKR